MDDRLKKLLDLLGVKEPEIYEGTLNEMTVTEANHCWFFDITFKQVLPVKAFVSFAEKMEDLPSRVPSITSCEFVISYEEMSYHELADYYDFVLKKLAKKKPRFSAIIDFQIEQENNRLELLCPSDATFVADMLKEVKEELFALGFDCVLATKVCHKQPSIHEAIDKESEKFMDSVKQTMQEETPTIHFVSFDDTYIRNIQHTIKDVPISETDMFEYKSMNENTMFHFEGWISKIEERKLNKQTTLYTMIVSDEDDSVYVKKFVKNPDELRFYKQTKAGMLIKVSGNAAFDQFTGEVTIIANKIERTDKVIEADPRTDRETEKRVELHLHSKMSTLDGITSIGDYVKTAKKWGHKAIALTDHGNVQGFPEFYHATKDREIKPIYGAEFTFVDERNLDIIKHPIDQHIHETTYTVFDIETTGLSVNYDKIIEIAAVKIKNHQIVEEYSTYVNPERPISMLTTKITSIKNSDLAVAPKIEEVIEDFYAFCKDTVMVAHNAHFDMGFIYESFNQHGIEVGKLPTIDTLSIARSCYNDSLKRFNLKAVARLFKVELTQHHRAIYDTRATADIFLHMLRDIRKQGIVNLQDLNQLSNKSKAYKHTISKHINILVKNQIGLKNLFFITSMANTKNYAKEAIVLKSLLDKHRGGLLVGSGCMNSDFFETALNKNEEELKEKARYFDYIEVQPLEDFRHMQEDMDHAMDRIEDTLNRIIKVAEELDIPVVATGDVHHLRKSDKKYRDIYVQTPVVGGGLHPLSRYKDIPSQYFRTTKEMLDAFSFLGEEKAKEVVVSNTNKIAEEIDFVQAFKNELYAPTDDFLALEGVPSIENKLIKMVSDKARELYGNPLPPLVKDRIDKEIKSITENKFSTVYYISHLLVKKSLDEGYLVGSRGSVGSSLVATLMDITEVNPLTPHYVCPNCHFSAFKMTSEEKTRYGLSDEELALQSVLDQVDSGFDLPAETCPKCNRELSKDGHAIPFETFLGFKGDKVPDIDLNFSGDYQPVVHEYIRDIFGKNRAFRAGTISTVAEKTAFGYVKGYLEKKNLSMRKAEIEQRAMNITGVKRSTGQHPGGIVVVPNYKEIIDVTPFQYPADDTSATWFTTHFDYHSFEDNLFKLDVLGHDDPTMIRYLMDYVKDHPIDFPFADARDIPIDDPKLYDLLNSTTAIQLDPSELGSEVASFGIPEMGTKFVRGMLRDSRPKSFADVVKISGLSHGTDVWLNNAETLVTGKNQRYGQIPFKEVIGCRDDIMVYLIENGMKDDIAFEISEFIRKGKAAKNPEKWSAFKDIMRNHKIPEWYIWSAGQIKYMFPKAHATAYVMMAMRIAWFKLYKPIVFYSAYFSKRATDFDVYAFQGGEDTIRKRMNEIEDKGNAAKETEKRLYTVLEIALEMVLRGYKFLPIDVEKSDARDFIISEDEKGLIMPFITIDGLGLKVAESIVQARSDGEFKSKDDIKERTSLSQTLFKKLDMLGCFDHLPDNAQMNLFEM